MEQGHKISEWRLEKYNFSYMVYGNDIKIVITLKKITKIKTIGAGSKQSAHAS